MRLVEIENKIKELIANDINDPEIYKRIYELALYFYKRKKLITNYQMAEEVASLCAEELYMRVYTGHEIHSWIGYINRSYQAYIRLWRHLNGSEIIDVTEDELLRESIVSMCSSSSVDYNKDFTELVNLDYLDGFAEILDELLEQSSKFQIDSKSYMNSKLTIMMSILAGKFIPFNLDESEQMYTQMLYSKISENLIKELRISDTVVDSSFSLLQLYAMSNADIEEQ